MRTIRIICNDHDVCYPDGHVVGKIGEHRATLLAITLPHEMIVGADYHVVVVKRGDRILFGGAIPSSSPMANENYYRDGNTVCLRLWKSLTTGRSIEIEIESHRIAEGGSEVIRKTPTIGDLRFTSTLFGEPDETIAEGILVPFGDPETLKRLTTNDNGKICDGNHPLILQPEFDKEKADRTISDLVLQYHYGSDRDDYLLCADYSSENLDYAWANEFFEERYKEPNIGACSSVRNGNWIGRDYDWYYDNSPSIVVRTAAINGRHAVVGVTQYTPITIDKADSRSSEDAELYKILPFVLLDGMNDAGVYANINVTALGDRGTTTGTNPNGDNLCGMAVVRYVLDHADSAYRAIELLQGMNIWFPHSNAVNEEFHFMISDKNETYIVEFVDNRMVYRKAEDEYGNPAAIMTNFSLVGANAQTWFDGTYASRADATEADDFFKPTEHPMGVERFDILKAGFANADSKNGMKSLMQSVKYSQTYDADKTPYWYSELSADMSDTPYGDLAWGTPIEEYEPLKQHVIELYESEQAIGLRESKTWRTVHTSVYDVENGVLYLYTQENYDKEFLFFANFKGNIVRSVDALNEKAHEHPNKPTLDKFNEENDTPLFNGKALEYCTPIITIELSQFTSFDPIRVELTEAQFNIVADEKNCCLYFDMSSIGAGLQYYQKVMVQQGFIFCTRLENLLSDDGGVLAEVIIDPQSRIMTYSTYPIKEIGKIKVYNVLPQTVDDGTFAYLQTGSRKGLYRRSGGEWEQVTDDLLTGFNIDGETLKFGEKTVDLTAPDTLALLELKHYDTLQFRENMAEVPVFIYDRIGFGIELYSADETEYIRYTDVTDVNGLPVPFLTVVTDGHEYTCWLRDYESTYWGDRDAGWYETTDGTETAMENPPLVENFTPAKFVVGVDPVTLENIVYTDLSNLPPKAASALRSLSQMVNVDAASMGEIDVPDGAIVRFAGVLEAGRHYNFDTSADVLTLTFPSVGWTTEDMQTVLDLHCVQDVLLTLPREKLLVDGVVPSTKAGDHRLIFTYVKSAGKFAVDGLDQITPPNWEVPDQVIPFGECTWDQIKAVAMHGYKSADGQWYIMRNGQREIWWEIGDEKTITLDGGEEVVLQIYGFNHDDLADGSGKAPLTLGTKNLLADTDIMNLTQTNAGGWNDSYMRSVVLRNIYNKLPTSLKQCISSVEKQSDVGRSTQVVTTFDQIFLFSRNEVMGSVTQDWMQQGTKYPIFTTNASRIKKIGSTDQWWWTRTSGSDTDKGFSAVNKNGTADTYSISASSANGICFGFCI